MINPNLLLGVLMPHPPLLIPEIGGEELSRISSTQTAMQALSTEIARLTPDVVVIISPHGPMFDDAVAVMGGDPLRGHLTEFGVGRRFVVGNDGALVDALLEAAETRDVPVYQIDDDIKKEFTIDMELDYGATVPYFHIKEAGYPGPLLHLTPGGLPPETLYAAGQCAGAALLATGRRAVVIASGDNSHALADDAPAGYREEGPAFDRFLQRALAESDWLALLTQDPEFLEHAAEDTVRSCALLLGIFDGMALRGEVLSHEGPFGVGYTVARFTPTGEETESLLPVLLRHRKAELTRIRAEESLHVRLARAALEAYVRDETWSEPPTPLPAELRGRAGCFVSIKENGVLRGCIGTAAPTRANLAEEIIQNAIHAGTEDDRFFPLEEDELEGLVYTVDVLGEEEPVHNLADLDPRVYGLIVIQGQKNALLLPDLSGVDSVEQQIAYTKEKAGIAFEDEEGVEYYRFRVERYK
ncbi:AmmeMemoRadiSam system protein A [Tumebacillus sp. DT12]|uniref:AmmeMemoRadiSam system protein A n=1 Tax=Tumebacillus lacus TaxID=2995335 RepID=A0ABT3WZI3_9BACL|nr:AmmeMemoRadiSam system protein A [Tumebacillus lacus]MCX7568690.1 AmmeMemoRadiSam system protein A [Tumebacillus lacus]